jgi:tetratricopeptide (TPR) repeat protein
LSLLVLSPILFLGLLEAGLRLGGYGYPTGFFLGPDAGGTCTANYRFEWRFFPRSLAREPWPCFLSAKPAKSIRIFVLGGSAAMGTPDPAFNFGQILAVMLREQYPGVQFEVVNGAMTAINSHVVREIARDCAAREPDLFVVYLGNNEVIGPYGPGTIFQRWSSSLTMVRSSIWAKSTRVGQLLGDVAGYFHRNENAPGSWRGMEMFLSNPVTADDPRLTVVYDNYRRNLVDICGIARRAGAPVILATVAVNLRDCPPFASLHRPGLAPEDLAKWESIYKAAGELEAGNRWHEAIQQYEAAAKIDDRFAELPFRIGLCLMKVGRWAEARERFELARDLDVLRFRADSRINAIIREVAGEQEAAGVRFVDAERALAPSDPDSKGIVGGDLFYEHVHLTFAGNYVLARAVLDQVCAALPQLAALGKPGVLPSKQRCAELLAMTPWDEYQSAAKMVELTSRKPFTNQLNHGLRQAEARQRRDGLRKLASTPQAMQAAWRIYEAALAKSPDDWSLHRHFGMLAMHGGRLDVAVEHLRLSAERLPWIASTQNDLGVALAGRGQIAESIAHYQKALEIKPDYAEAHNNLGNVLAGRGQVAEAIAHYQSALEIEPDYAEAHNSLGIALSIRGQADEAIAHYEKALEIKPDYAEAHNSLGAVLAMRGQIAEANAHFQKAVEIDPDCAEAHNNLGNVLAGRGQVDEAIAHYRRAVEIKPDFAEPRRHLESLGAK